MFRFFNTKKGSAMIQVLVLGSIIATVVVLLLRFSNTRAVNVMKTSRLISAKAFAEGCMAQFTADAMLRELHGRPPHDNISDIDFMLTNSTTPTMLTGGRFNCTIEVGTGADRASLTKPMEFEGLPGLFYQPGAGASVAIPPTLTRVTIDVDNTQDLR